MSAIRLITVLRRLCKMAVPAEGDSTDDQLLRRCLWKDREALESLVRRHGPLVWRVCRRVLPQPDQAEDAFQAPFLVLATRAGSIRKPASLASWLHGAAYRIASRIRAEQRHLAAHGEPREPVASPDPAQEAAWRELGRLLEDEVAALPEHLRLPILLCYWEGKTNEEAARQLGWPCGTVKTRLGQARRRLHERLLRRGVTLPAGLLTVLLAPSDTVASLPASLATTTLHTLRETSGTATKLAGLAEHGIAPGRRKVPLLLFLALTLIGV